MNEAHAKLRTSTKNNHLCMIQMTNYSANFQQEWQKGRNRQIWTNECNSFRFEYRYAK